MNKSLLLPYSPETKPEQETEKRMRNEKQKWKNMIRIWLESVQVSNII